MKLIDQIRRQPAFISFGRSSADGGFVNVELAAVRSATSVTLTAADGSAAPIASADATKAGVLTATDKIKLDGLTVGGGQTPPTDFAHRTLVTAATIDPGVSHLRTAGYSAIGDGGGALYRRVATQPAHDLKVQSADGAWWELVPDPVGVSILQAGGKADSGTTDNAVAFRAILGYGRLNANSKYSGSLPILYPAAEGKYHHFSTLSVKQPCVIRGGGGNMLSNRATLLTWPALTDGIVFEFVDTEYGNPSPTVTTGANGSIIEGLTLTGGGSGGATEPTLYNGITIRANSVLVRDVNVELWPGDGIHIQADVNTAGNANTCRISGGLFQSNRRFGLYLSGGDVNAYTIDGLNCSSNGGAGIYDDSFLGGAMLGGHTAANRYRALVHHGGNRYHVNPLAIEDGLSPSTEQPGTGNAWVLEGAGGTGTYYSDWVSGTDYYPGGGVVVTNPNARTGIFGMYQEGDQPPGYLEAQAFHVGGIQQPYTGPGSRLSGNDWHGTLEFFRPDDTAALNVQIRAVADQILALVATDHDHSQGWKLKWDGAIKAWTWLHANLGARRRIIMHSNTATSTFGRSVTPTDGALQLGEHFAGQGNDARWRATGTAAPASGAYARGDIVFNRDPSAGGSIGWVCVASGSPGTWKTFGTIAV